MKIGSEYNSIFEECQSELTKEARFNPLKPGSWFGPSEAKSKSLKSLLDNKLPEKLNHPGAEEEAWKSLPLGERLKSHVFGFNPDKAMDSYSKKLLSEKSDTMAEIKKNLDPNLGQTDTISRDIGTAGALGLTGFGAYKFFNRGSAAAQSMQQHYNAQEELTPKPQENYTEEQELLRRLRGQGKDGGYYDI